VLFGGSHVQLIRLFYVQLIHTIIHAHLSCIGTGKSEILKAFLWYAFQHKMTSLIAVSAYTWKAATLVGSSANPGMSTTQLFGTTTTYNRRSGNGGSKKSQANFNSEIRFLLVDEISFCSKIHFMVRCATF